MYKLTPVVKRNIRELLEKENILLEAVEYYSSPLNVLFPENMSSNVESFRKIFDKYDIDGKIFFAHKPNKSKSFAQQAFQNGINIDVASVNELQNAIDSGFAHSQIEATGPKSKSFLKACIEHDIFINVDSFFELEAIKELASHKVKILIRLSNFASNEFQIASKLERFGIEVSKVDEVLKYLLQNKDNFDLYGFSFHLNNNSLEERIVAFLNIFDALRKAKETGFPNANVLNFGGGFQPNYIEDKDEWDDFLIKLKEFVEGKSSDRLSFTGTKFGYYFDGQAVKGNYTFQDFYNWAPKELFLDKILSRQISSLENCTIGDVISENLLELWIEPGQGLLDQCGITVARVIGVKEVKGEKVIFTEMNYTNLDSDRYELFTDPILISSKSKKNNTQGYFVSGNLCLSIDLIANHKIYLDYEPEPDDLLVFINTAPYRMDFVESEPLQNPIAKKVVWHSNQLISEQEYISKFKSE